MRHRDWQQHFAAFVAQRRGEPFAWGSNDCCLFAADAVRAMTGADPAAALRGYETALQAARIVEEQGGLASIATEALGEPIPPQMAAIGDVVLFDNGGRECLGVCNGQTILGPGESGMAVAHMQAASMAWRI